MFETITNLCALLPAYAEIELTFAGTHGKKVNRLMARDYPGNNRRFTNLDTGGEWFLPFNYENLDIIGFRITKCEIGNPQ